jgi:hypothetical protein
MKPVDHPQATHRFGAPENWNEEIDGPCGILKIKGERVNGKMHFVSVWKLTSEDWAAINNGGHVELTCVGVQPPVAIRCVRLPGDVRMRGDDSLQPTET